MERKQKSVRRHGISFFRRPGSPFWWYAFTLKGARFRESAGTDELHAAEGIALARRQEVIGQEWHGRKDTITVTQACARYWLQCGSYQKSAEKSCKYELGHIERWLGKNTPLQRITGGDVRGMVAAMREERTSRLDAAGKRTKMSAGTINRTLNRLRSLLNVAREDWGVETPDMKIADYKLREPDARTRWLSRDEAEMLIAAAAPHLRPIIRFALLTGLRRGNILGLTWEQVNLRTMEITVGLKSDRAGGKRHTLPITPPMMALLSGIGIGQSGPVFTYRYKKHGRWHTRPVREIKRSFATACAAAGIRDFRFHDLRHTAASWMIQDGVPLEVVKDVLGHEDIETTMKYAHHKDDSKRTAMMTLAAQYCHNEKEGNIA